MSYTRTDAPRLSGLTEEEAIRALARYIDIELRKVENEMKTPSLRGVQFESLAAEPARYKDGDLYYGIAGVFGGSAGLYVRDTGNWRKL
jgi:hypothetical protein